MHEPFRFLLSSAETAESLGISERTLYSITAPRGTLKCVRLPGCVKYRPIDISTWLDSQQANPLPPRKRTIPIVRNQRGRRTTGKFRTDIGVKLAEKLADVGLIERRQKDRKSDAMTVGRFLNELLERRRDHIKPGTFVSYGHTVRNLKEYFKSETLLESITPADADDFKRHLRNKEKLSSATVVRRCQYACAFFKDACRGRLITSNPFEGLGKGSMANPKRQRFIDQQTIQKVIDVCPNAEWRLLVALSRFGGLRVPSEPLLLRWVDVDTGDWERMVVHSPKTEHHEGHESRVIPIFAELKPYLIDAFEIAEEGAEWVLPSLRRPGIHTKDWRNVNFGTSFIKIIKKAQIEPWPKVWHNLRSSRQTELTDIFPSHVVTAWLGNSEKVAEAHYLQVLDSHFEKARNLPVEALHKAVQYPPETAGNGQRDLSRAKRKTPENTAKTVVSGVSSMGDTGFETYPDVKPKTSSVPHRCAEYVHEYSDASLNELIDLWPLLSPDQQGRILQDVRQFSGDVAEVGQHFRGGEMVDLRPD